MQPVIFQNIEGTKRVIVTIDQKELENIGVTITFEPPLAEQELGALYFKMAAVFYQSLKKN